MNTKYDLQFNRLVELNWLPWVGDHYDSEQSDTRHLIVGESHYLKDNPKSLESHSRSSFTRLVIEEQGLLRQYAGTKMIPNLHKTLYGNDRFDSSNLWQNLAFYNFIQEPMGSLAKRPIKSQYANGWEVFFKILDILQPTNCLFVGNTSFEYLQPKGLSQGIELVSKRRLEKVGSAYAKKVELELNGKLLRLDFIRHTSQYYSWKKWRESLSKNGSPFYN